MKTKFVAVFCILTIVIVAISKAINPFWVQQGLLAIILISFIPLALASNQIKEITKSTKDLLVRLIIMAHLSGFILSMLYMELPSVRIFLIESPAMIMVTMAIVFLYSKRNVIKTNCSVG